MPDASLFDLTGRTALVTGASRGIGAAIAAGLAAAGADIVATAREGASLEETASRVRDTGRSFSAHELDLATGDSVDHFLHDLTASGQVPDILVNNAGTIERAPALEHTDAQWDLTLGVDLTQHFRITREVGRAMVDRGSGKVIFTASLLSFQGGINVVSYTSAKAGILGLTKALANEWASSGVTVNSLVPGYIETDNTQALQDDPRRRKAIEDRIPMGRWGVPEDLVGAAVFLSAQASAYVTGTQVVVDGGWLSR